MGRKENIESGTYFENRMGRNQCPNEKSGGNKLAGKRCKKEKLFLEEIQIDPVQKRKVLGKIAEAVEEKRYFYRPCALEVFCRQLKYISGFCIGGQAACVLLLLVLFWRCQMQGEEMLSYLGIGSAGAAYMGVFLMLELGRSRDCGMAELEQSCYLNVRQAWCVKMVCFGCLDTAALTAMVAVIAGNTPYGMLRALVYLLVPFVLSNGMQLLAFTMFRGQKKGYLQMAAAFAAGGVSLLPLQYPIWYRASYFGIWVCILAAAVLFLAKEIAGVCQKLEEGETLCWN